MTWYIKLFVAKSEHMNSVPEAQTLEERNWHSCHLPALVHCSINVFMEGRGREEEVRRKKKKGREENWSKGEIEGRRKEGRQKR